MIPVYDGDEIVGEVAYNDDLDFWDGHNYTRGSTGRHLGIARLESGDYVLIHGTQWQGERNHAEVIDAERAVQEILKSGNSTLFDEERFSELGELKERSIAREV